MVGPFNVAFDLFMRVDLVTSMQFVFRKLARVRDGTVRRILTSQRRSINVNVTWVCKYVGESLNVSFERLVQVRVQIGKILFNMSERKNVHFVIFREQKYDLKSTNA